MNAKDHTEFAELARSAGFCPLTDGTANSAARHLTPDNPGSPTPHPLTLTQIWKKHSIKNESARNRIRVHLNNALRNRRDLETTQQRSASGWEILYPAQLVDEIVTRHPEIQARAHATQDAPTA